MTDNDLLAQADQWVAVGQFDWPVASKLIADLAAALRARDTEVRELKATVSQLYEQIEMLHDRVAR